MQESQLLRASLIFSIIGLVLLALVSQLAAEPLTAEPVQQSEYYRMQGVIHSLRSYDKVHFLEVVRPEPITVVVFDERNLSLQKGDYVRISGEVREYKNASEIVADSIELLVAS